jgi:hypothetical protein
VGKERQAHKADKLTTYEPSWPATGTALPLLLLHTISIRRIWTPLLEVFASQCKAIQRICVHLLKPEKCNFKINLTCKYFYFSCFGQHDDGDVTYFAASLRVACEDSKSERDVTSCH